MAISVFPVTDQPVTETQWGQLWAPQAFSGVFGYPSNTALLPYRTAGGLFVRPGVAINCGTRFEISGADEQVSGLVANTGGSSRFDLLTLRRQSGAVSLQYVVGGGTSPTPQSDPATVYDVPLGVCTVPSGSTIPAAVADARFFMDQGVVPCRVADDVPSARRRLGMIAVEESGQAKVYQGSSTWTALATNPGVVRLTGVGPALDGTPPTAAAGGWSLVPGSVVNFTDDQGYASIPLALPNGLLTCLVAPGDETGGGFAVVGGGAGTALGSRASYPYRVFGLSGDALRRFQHRVNYLAIGW